MSRASHPRSARALVTEVLPHELPLIFTNDFHYLSLVESGVTAADNSWLDLVRDLPNSKRSRYTRPYEFQIRKDRGGATSLGVVHPRSQREAAEFYDSFAETLLASCTLSPFSLRRPSGLARLSAQAPFKEPDSAMQSVHQEDDEEELSRIVSFFAYRDFNLLGKFFDSSMFINLEKRFSKLRTLDVSKCFHSLYTHSVSWAIKSKDLAKEHPKHFAFEQNFDLLMQHQNYNETNGIVIGPELSRVFAEIIFQKIDANVVSKCAAVGLIHSRHYEVRRYVDDYFIFANTDEDLAVIEEIVARELLLYKLHINAEKTSNLSRPFVTPLSTAKREIGRAIFELKESVDAVKGVSDASKYRTLSKKVNAKTQEARLIIGEHGVGFHNISGFALSMINVMVVELVDSANLVKDDDVEKIDCIEKSIWSLFRLSFYIASLDVRVNTTYALANMLQIKDRKGFKKIGLNSDWLEHVLLKELIDLLKLSHDAFFRRMKRFDAVETLNILIIGAHFFKKDFVKNVEVRDVIDDLRGAPTSYFIYISIKFAMLCDVNFFSAALTDLNARATKKVVSMKEKLGIDTEAYFLLADLLSAPDLDYQAKRNLWSEVVSKTPPSNAGLDFVGSRCGFVDWHGLRMKRLLARKKLRPVYE